MNLEEIKLNLVKMIKDKGRVSFVEIENYFDEIGFDYHGEEKLASSYNNKIIFWAGWSERSFKLIRELLKDELIKMGPAPALVYHFDGKELTLPVYKDDKPYEQWFPVVLN